MLIRSANETVTDKTFKFNNAVSTASETQLSKEVAEELRVSRKLSCALNRAGSQNKQ